MPPINLLPRELVVREREQQLQLGLAGVAVAVVALLVVLFFVAQARVSREEDALEREQVATQELRDQVGALQEFQQLQDQITNTRQTLAAALSADVSWSRFMNDLSLVMPDNSWLTNMALSATGATAPDGFPSHGTVSFTGFVFNFPGLAGWLQRTVQVDGLHFLYLSTGTRQEMLGQQVVSFSANANVTDELLSRRCQEGQRCP